MSVQVGTTGIDRIYDTREGAARGGEGEEALTLVLDCPTSLLLEELDVGPCSTLEVHIGEYKPVYPTLRHAYLSSPAALTLQGDHDLALARLAIAIGCHADIDPLGNGIGRDGDPLIITLGSPEVGPALHIDGAGLAPLTDRELTRAGTTTGMSYDNLRALTLHDRELATHTGCRHDDGPQTRIGGGISLRTDEEGVVIFLGDRDPAIGGIAAPVGGIRRHADLARHLTRIE